LYKFVKYIVKLIFPKSFIRKNEALLRYLISLKYRGSTYQCNICLIKLKKFVHLSGGDQLCPKCGSRSRGRRLYKQLNDQELLVGNVLHFSPPKCLYDHFTQNESITYFPTDFENEFVANYSFDITKIELPNNYIDVIICYHILEHIENDSLAMKELVRVLKPSGKAIIQTPFKEGDIYEDDSIKTEKERTLAFGQKDHVRIYSKEGLAKRLILIPTYNTDISTLVYELLRQTEKENIPFEIIYCEDASSKNVESNEVLTKNSQVIKLINDTNLGRTATRSKLANKAKYLWLLFLDADVTIEKPNFISNYLLCLDKTYPIIMGGTSYSKTKTEHKELRWVYGTKREAKDARQRMQNPSFIISQNLFIKKDVFLQLNTIQTRRYGLDNLFSYHIHSQGYDVLHINNPIIHLGLELNEVFIKKSLNAIETIDYHERQHSMGSNFTSLQKSYFRLKKNKALFLFKIIVRPFSTKIYNNLLSKKPSLFLFDIYRLNHYIKLKENA